MKFWWAVAAATCVVTAPAMAGEQLRSGIGGDIDFIVTSGYFDPADIYHPDTRDYTYTPPYSLVGYTGNVRFTTKAYDGVAITYPPGGGGHCFTCGFFDPYFFNTSYTNLSTPDKNVLYSLDFFGSNEEPDPGTIYEQASFIGDKSAGSYHLLYSYNGGEQRILDFTFSDNGRSGSGRFRDSFEGNEYPELQHVDFTFAITNGGTYAFVPEPATWGMMISGFGLAGSALRRRRHMKVEYA